MRSLRIIVIFLCLLQCFSIPPTNASNTKLKFNTEIHDSKIWNDLKEKNIKFLAFPPFLKPSGTEVVEINSNFTVVSPSISQQGFGPLEKIGTQFVTIGGKCISFFTGSSSCDSLVFFSEDSNKRTLLNLQSATGLDQHDLVAETINSFWGMRYSIKSCSENLNLCGGDLKPKNVTHFADCEVVNFDRNGELKSTWSAAQHLSSEEVLWEYWKNGIYQNSYADPFHCNSIDLNKKSKKMLVSMRHTNSVYAYDIQTGLVEWKIGGKVTKQISLSPKSSSSSISLGGQHDARWVSQSSITLLDNASNTGKSARGLILAIDNSNYKVLQVFDDPSQSQSQCTGSFRRFNLENKSYFVAGWGCSANGATLFTSRGKPIVSIAPDGKANSKHFQFDSGPMTVLNSVLSYRIYPILIRP
jgi:hypothetical protein